MSFKRALVVDDSRAARLALKTLLEKHDLIVDFAESGEDAIEFLKSHAVDVIFMDHTMPGMTGLEAVSAIKADPRTAMIPVMMYTAREGEVYVGQARALGAVGVLPKQVQPGVLFEMLLKLGLVKERRGKSADKPPPPRAAQNRRHEDRQRELAEEDIDRQLDQQAIGMSVQALVSRILQDQHVELRSDILRSHHEFARRVAQEIFERQKAELGHMEPPAPPPKEPGVSTGAVVGLALLLIVPTLFLLFRFLDVRAERDAALAENARLAAAAQQQVMAARSEASDLVSSLTDQQVQSDARYRALLSAVGWALNEGAVVPFGEPAFGGRRQELLQELLSQLAAVGFRGTVRMESHLGEFCLVNDGAGGYMLPDPSMPLEGCDFLGHPLETSSLVSDRQSVAFANFLATSPLVNGSGIDVEVVAHDRASTQRRVQFPPGMQTAGEWNQVARRNNRIEFVLVPEGS
ncbi:MAG: response regulator [Gammaproteobacteria bacterium]